MKRAEVVLARLSPHLPRPQRHAAMRTTQPAALYTSAELAGAPRDLPCKQWPRDMGGAPSVVRGWYASLSGTPALTAAVVAPFPIGVDVEYLKRERWEVARELFRRAGEIETLGSDACQDVLALWTAKEALVKLSRVGIVDLCRVGLVRREGEAFTLRYKHLERLVQVRTLGNHVLSLATEEPVVLAVHELRESP